MNNRKRVLFQFKLARTFFQVVAVDGEVIFEAVRPSLHKVKSSLPVPFNNDSDKNGGELFETWDNLSHEFSVVEVTEKRVVIRVVTKRQNGFWYYSGQDIVVPPVGTTTTMLTATLVDKKLAIDIT